MVTVPELTVNTDPESLPFMELAKTPAPAMVSELRDEVFTVSFWL